MTEQRGRRILIVTRNLPPLVGGMERLNWHMAEQLSQSAHVRIIGPTGSAAMAPPDIEVDEVPLRPLWRFIIRAMQEAIGVASRWKPDIVLAGSGLTAPIALFAARICKARAAVYLHGLDIATPHRVYRALWLPAIRRMDYIIANSSATREIALDKGVPEARIAVLHPGVDLPMAAAADDAGAGFRQQYGLGEGPILLSVGRLAERKGLREFVQAVLPRVAAEHRNAQLVVIGDTPDQALAARSQTRESILHAARNSGVADRIHFIGTVTDQELLRAYCAASVHVFPVREIPGDPEGFGMVAVEAAAHGVPTAAYATGGIVDAIREGVSGHLAPPGESTVLAAHISTLLRQRLPKQPMLAFAEQFTWSRFGARLDALLR